MLNAKEAAGVFLNSHARIMADRDTYHNGGRNTKGHVGAEVRSPGRDPVWAQSYFDECLKLWVHAERAAIEKALKLWEVDLLPERSEVFSTLEPCFLDADRNPHMALRKGCSCSQLLADHKVKVVYAGVRDDEQKIDGEWPKHAFELVLTKDANAIKACEELLSLLRTP